MCVAVGGLPASKLRHVTEYIQDNLHTELRLGELSGLVHMSPYHFARLFNSTSLPPHQFVVRRRIDRAYPLPGQICADRPHHGTVADLRQRCLQVQLRR